MYDSTTVNLLLFLLKQFLCLLFLQFMYIP
jgi:hypothetical protein